MYYYPDDCGCRNEAGKNLFFSLGWGKSTGGTKGGVLGVLGWLVYQLFIAGPCECEKESDRCHCVTPPSGPNGNGAWPDAKSAKSDPLAIDLNRDGSTNLTNKIFFDYHYNDEKSH